MALRASSEPSVEPSPLRLDLAAVFRDHYVFVWTNLHRLAVPREQIEDAAQDVFVVVMRHLAEFEGRATLRTWLYAITRRVAYRHRRATARRLRKLTAFREEPREGVTLDGIARTDSSLLVHHFLARLDDEKREAFVLAELEGLSGPEIADALGIKVRTAYSRVRLAREAFDRVLARMHAEEDRVLARRRVLAEARAADGPGEGVMRRAMAVFVGRLSEMSAGVTRGGAEAGLIAKVGLGAKVLSAVGAMKTVLITAAVSTVVTAGVTTMAMKGVGEREGIAESGGSRGDDGERGAPEPSPVAGLGDAAMVPGEIRPPARTTRTTELHETINVEARAPSESDGARGRRTTVDVPQQSRAVVDASELTVDGILREKQLVEDALLQLESGSASGALELLDRAAREVSVGVMTSERRKLRIRALCASGRVEQARGEAEAWRAREPSSPHAKAAVLLCPR